MAPQDGRSLAHLWALFPPLIDPIIVHFLPFNWALMNGRLATAAAGKVAQRALALSPSLANIGGKEEAALEGSGHQSAVASTEGAVRALLPLHCSTANSNVACGRPSSRKLRPVGAAF